MSGYPNHAIHLNNQHDWEGSNPNEDNDDTYLRMNQFKDPPKPVQGQLNISSQLGNILLRHNNDNAAFGHDNQQFRKSGEFPGLRFDNRPSSAAPDQRSRSIDWTNAPSLPMQPGRRPRPSVPNYTPVNLKNKVHRPSGPHGNPPIQSRAPARLPGEGPDVDGQEAYMTFDEHTTAPQGYLPPYNPAGPPNRRGPAPIPVHQPYGAEHPAPPLFPRSPVHSTSQYDDHQLPPNLRPPPPPPQTTNLPPHPKPSLPQYPLANQPMSPPQYPKPSQPQYPIPNFPPHRSGSDKKDSPRISPAGSWKTREQNISTDSSLISPVASHETSWKTREQNISTDSGHSSPGTSREPSYKNNGPFRLPLLSHKPERTGSNSSTSSDDLTQAPKSSTIITSGFSKMKQDNKGLQKFQPPPNHRPSIITAMPGFVAPKSAEVLEDQPWHRDVSRKDAMAQISASPEEGMFIVRPRETSNTQPYALTLWGNNKIYHFIIRKRDDGEYALGTAKEGEQCSSTVMKLVEYHQNNVLFLPNNEGSVKLTKAPN